MSSSVSSPALFRERLQSQQARIDRALERLTPPESEYPPSIHQAMRYSLFAGGKRIRPILCLEAAAAVSDATPGIEAPASALEMIHTYSLIHDDLPALDNDDFRRGKPTCHKVFGEAIAILAGDALLTRAFQVVGEMEAPPERRIAIVRELAQAAGTVNGMIGGQVADLEAERKPVEEAHLHYIHRAKTAALIRASLRVGAIFAGASDSQLHALSRFGEQIGLAFQIVDDVLDVVESSAGLGKTAGKDAQQQKATFPALYGVERSREMARHAQQQAVAALEPFGERAVRLRELAALIVERSA
ncbi:MAG TPA: farnesyl diphosphate synthase [Bryobacterales bacterium]|nr:farnesyl diphosphate synthase [Bryobacterales bacterium]